MSSKSSNRLAAMVREPVTVAIVVAVLITGVLAFAVLAIWSGGGGSPQLAAPALEQADVTPTPRAIHWPRATPAASPPPSSVRRSAPAGADVPQISANFAATTLTAGPSPVRSPQPNPTDTSVPAPSPSPSPAPTPAPTTAPTATATPSAEAAFEAADAASFNQMVGGRWYVAGNRLVFDAPQATSEPWILAPFQAPTGDFAVEAEIRVDGLGQGYCNQSFGLVAGSEQLGRFWGGGFIYGCGTNTPLARITDVSSWTDGYDRDRILASAAFESGRNWHVLRLEVRGNELRLLIDGIEVLTATDDQLRAGLSSGQGGLWTQGVRLTVRRLVIYEL